ncbi:ABC transporter permease [Asticcacaulis solisilvae]|uniref:ABC transporter permease n=1 Tax=Asticcacaulis solisilvae TaxID=1217274 RepID=UPI003FD85736
MLTSAFAAFFRSFTRHPLYALLNLLGLSFGIAAFITLSLLYHFETNYERWSPERPHVYAIGMRVHVPGVPDDLGLKTTGGLLEDIKTAWPQVDGTRDFADWFIVHRGANVIAENMEFVDPNFLTFFKVPILRGDPATALADPSHIVVSAAIARKYFGTVEAIGRPLTLGNAEGINTYTISAVIADLPKNSDMRFDMLRRLTPDLGDKYMNGWHALPVPTLKTYLKFKSPADAAHFAAQLPAFVDHQAGANVPPGMVPHKLIDLSLVPLADIHLLSPKLKAAIASLGVVGILALGLALINYVNLATARAGLRAREVAVRKTLGAPPPALRLQFLIEAVLTLLLAFVVALSAVELTLPLINAAGGLSLVLYPADAGWVLALLGCVLLAGLVAALYPAFVLSAFKPAQVLASSRTPGGGRAAGWLRTGLVMMQFIAVVVAFVLMAGFMLQVRHIQTADLGFRRDNLMVAGGLLNSVVTPAQRESFIVAARTVPGVRYASFANTEPGPGMDSVGGFGRVLRPGQPPNAASALGIVFVGQDYFQMMDAHLLSGRLFDLQHGEDQMWSGPDEAKSGRMISAVINRTAARALGFASSAAAIGQTARFLDGQLRIIGVVDDMRLKSPYEAIQPTVYLFYAHPTYTAGMVRYQGVSEAAMRKALTALWRQINPDVPLDVVVASENLDAYYRPERDRSRLFTIGTGIGALIGCIGLYGMAAFNTGRRVREIGMRKVLGASRGQVVTLLLVQFLRPVAAAGLIACPLAWIILQRWLAQFDDAIATPLWLFPSACAAALLIALLTVAGVAFAAASTEPGKALRHE